MSPRKGPRTRKPANATTFELFVRMLNRTPSEEEQAMELKAFLSEAYSRAGWTEQHLEQDAAVLADECITSKDVLRAVVSAGYHYNIPLPLVVLDTIAQSLLVPIKLRFQSATDQQKSQLDDLINRRHREAFAKERIHKAGQLLCLAKKSWKKTRLPAGLKVQVERIMGGVDAVAEGVARMELSAADDLRMKVVAPDGKVYETNRYCPHKGVDLQGAPMEGSILTCPKHKWKFDLSQGGKCIEGKFSCSLHAKRLEW